MKQPNIIFLISDQMQKKVIDPKSQCIMPNVRRMATDGVSFKNAHTINAICSPSRASLITGVLPHNHGMVDCTHTVPGYRAEYNYDLPTLPACIKQNGYSTAYFGKWHIERGHELSRFGFDVYETERTIPKRQFTPLEKIAIHSPGYKDNTICGVYGEKATESEEYYIYERGIDFIDRSLDKNEPFCLFLSSYAPHDPYTVPKEVYDLYEGTDITLPENIHDKCLDKPNIYRRLQGVWNDLSDSDIKRIIRCYYSSCTVVDIQIGKLIDYLKKKNIYDNTILVFLSDHGDMLGSHGLFCKGIPAFEETYSIPFIIKLPHNSAAGTVCEAHVSTCDIFPTIVNIAALNGGAINTDGKNIMPYLSEADPSDTCTLAEFFGQRYAASQRIVWKNRMKYVFNTFDFDELYNLETDPGEMHNLAHDIEYSEIKQDLVKTMWNLIDKTGDWSMKDAQYYLHRFAPAGPGDADISGNFHVYNNSF
jgi:choline-sulfatase